MSIRTTVSFEGVPPLDSDTADLLLDSLLEQLPDAGPIFAQNMDSGVLDVVLSFDVEDAELSGSIANLMQDGAVRAAKALRDAGFPTATWASIRLERIPTGASLASDREHAFT